MNDVIAFVSAEWFVVVSWMIRLGAVVIVPFRRSAAEARTWLLIFFIVPIPALVIYLLIGRPEHSSKRKELFAKLPDILQRTVERAGLNTDFPDAGLPENSVPSANLAEALGLLPPLSGNAITLLPDYKAAIDALVADIDDAEHHVHLEFYIFANDRTGKRVMDALKRASARGVTCRVLIDAMGSMTSARAVERRLKKAGIEVHRILPLWRRWHSSRIDLRNHRKIAVIDGHTGFTGSQNLINARVTKSLSHKELMVRVTGPAASELQAVFLADWYLETESEIEDEALFSFRERKNGLVAQVLPSGPDYQTGGVDLFFAKIIHDAREDVVIVTPYFIPTDALIAAIRTAAIRGVNVRLVVSKKSDSLIVKLAQRSYYEILLEAGVDICLYQADFLHAKHMRIDDDLCVIGSSNMDLRSFELNAEVSLICYGEEAAEKLKSVENVYAKDCKSIDKERWSKRPLPVKLVENMARLLSDLL